MDALQYLVPTKARRRLLLGLWTEGSHGTVSELAHATGLAFASAHRELKAMKRVGLVEQSRQDGREVFRANASHPAAGPLRALLGASVRSQTPARAAPAHVENLLRELAALGAPLRGVEAAKAPTSDLAELLARAVTHSRRDPVVARALPVLLWRQEQEQRLDVHDLLEHLHGAEDKHAMGFLLALTGQLGGAGKFEGWADMFRDRRVRSVRDYFVHEDLRLGGAGEFPLAQAWGFRMKAELDSFRSLFEKFVQP